MNQRFLSVLLFALAVAAGASLLLYRLMASRAMVQASPATTKVILAARTLEVGTLIREADLMLGDWAGPLPPGATRKKADIVGRGVIAAIYCNEPFVESRLALRGAGAGLAALIPAGMRAVAVRVNEVVGVAGFVVPGMRVDVLISGDPPGGSRAGTGSMTKTILQNVEVLSAGQNFQKDVEGKPVSVQVVNLLVSPAQAEILSLASSHTTLQLVLRNPLDREIAAPPGSAMASLFFSGPPHRAAAKAQAAPGVFATAPPPPAPRPARPLVVEMLHGSKRVDATFEQPPTG